ncbi:nuclear transport factor 2 family protein [Amycolatopsis rubida]|uniref:Nuclear transport factor 2 family protein n=2 Tax=Pseudonocardiaceae TaxID=2070 RepID=A0ABX0BXY3_9PSEU|nr:nuclear transport factor 2 family protein [Amycolatopsis rubida]MYW94932.1 nuclear transport factor 2 family protein [Amycolatopsis rubida]NEC59919.1 nuclear transport factor 2 family protein [Amycolatopsis rubida]OAP23324.1 hypothetical protein A4R44_05971 [Amycolatopsis sp. M39]
MGPAGNDKLGREFAETLSKKDAGALAPFLAEDVVFAACGDEPVRGRDAVVAVIAEQVHGLAPPGGKLAPIRTMAGCELSGGKIAAWRDYPDPAYAATLLQA